MVLMLMEIKRWLQQPKVRKLVCFISSIVGLICYACSSSFNRLFGKWTLWKISLYIAFSFFIVYLVHRFATKTVHFSSPGMKAHSAFSVLLITSVYSFFVDKKVEGKSDVYSLVSSAAFAITCLGLSTDFLYFFCGLLIVQLMKINFWLVIVGGSFSYSLLILRSNLDALSRSGYLELHVPDHLDIEIASNSQGSCHISSQVDSTQVFTGADNTHLMIIRPQEADATPQNEDLGFSFTQVGSPSQEGNSGHDNSIMARFMGCIEALKKENTNVIHTISKHVDKYLKTNVVDQNYSEIHRDDNLVMDALPPGIINDLSESARLMVKAGFEEECCRAYCSCRREFMNEILSIFGLQVQELKRKEIDMMEIKSLNALGMIVFPNERRLCDRVFEGSISSMREVYSYLTIPLMIIVNALAIWSNSPSPFSGKFLELKRLILTYGDKVQATVPCGGLHPITCEVMNYIRDVSINRNSSLRQDLEEYTMMDRVGKLSLSVHMAKITKLLERRLKANSRNYNNPSLGYFFIMNNRRFIELEVELYGLGPIIGDDWLRKNRIKFQQNLQLYQRSSWNKIVNFLKLDINESPNVETELLKNKLNSFNEHFDEICNVQSTWFVFDEQLREQIIKSIDNILLPAYGSFIKSCQDFLGKQAYEYIKYGIFDVKEQVNNLFLVREY